MQRLTKAEAFRKSVNGVRVVTIDVLIGEIEADAKSVFPNALRKDNAKVAARKTGYTERGVREAKTPGNLPGLPRAIAMMITYPEVLAFFEKWVARAREPDFWAYAQQKQFRKELSDLERFYVTAKDGNGA